MTNNATATVMIVDLSIDPARRADFDSFYHDLYIPAFLKIVPEIHTAKRYAQTNILNKVDPAKAHFLTVYELVSDLAIENIEAAIAKSAHQETSQQFKQWKQNGFTYFDRAFFQEVYRHASHPDNGCWDGHCLYALQWTVKSNVVSPAEQCHSNEYVNQLMNKVPLWLACCTYLRMNSQPHSFLTVFESNDHASLLQSLTTASNALTCTDEAITSDMVENALTLDLIYSHQLIW